MLASELDAAARQALAAVSQSPARKETLRAVARNPGTYKQALAEDLGVTTNAIRQRLRPLREVGVVEQVADESNASAARPYFITERGEAVLEVLGRDE